MLLLDATTKSVEAVLEAAPAANQPSFMLGGVDYSSGALTPYSNDGALSGVTPVTLAAAPGSGVRREMRSLIINNRDTAAVNLLIRLNNNSTIRKVGRFTLPVDSSLTFSKKDGFRMLRPTGFIQRTGSAGIIRDLTTYLHVTGQASIAANYPAGCVNGIALSTLALVANTFYARPFIAPYRKSPTIDRVGVYVTTGAASSNIRIGIYSTNPASCDISPATLLWDSGDLATATSSQAVTATPNLVLVPGQMYWAVIFSSGIPTLRAFAANAVAFGIADSLNSSGNYNGFLGTATGLSYGALPTQFPSVAANTSASPIVFVRYSA